MSRLLVLAFSLASYVVGFGGLTYFMLFVGGFWFLPIHVDSSPADDVARAAAINLGLIALFGLQHSVMARTWFKRFVKRFIPVAAERSLYVFASGAALLVLCAGWQSIDGTIWSARTAVGRAALIGLYMAGWSLAVAASFAIDHFELFGLRQGVRHFLGIDEPAPSFTERWLYKFVRHPLQCGVLVGLWATPTMTASHLMLAAAMSVYIAIGLALEERTLEAELGEDYANYRRRVPKLFPRLRRRPEAALEPAT